MWAAFMTRMPARVAASRSTPSNPWPKPQIARAPSMAAMVAASTPNPPIMTTSAPRTACSTSSRVRHSIETTSTSSPSKAGGHASYGNSFDDGWTITTRGLVTGLLLSTLPERNTAASDRGVLRPAVASSGGGVGAAADRDHRVVRVPQLDVGHPHRAPDLDGAGESAELAAPGWPEEVHPEVDGRDAPSELGSDRVVASDVDQRRDHAAVEPVGAVGTTELVAPGKAHLDRALLSPD